MITNDRPARLRRCARGRKLQSFRRSPKTAASRPDERQHAPARKGQCRRSLRRRAGAAAGQVFASRKPADPNRRRISHARLNGHERPAAPRRRGAVCPRRRTAGRGQGRRLMRLLDSLPAPLAHDRGGIGRTAVALRLGKWPRDQQWEVARAASPGRVGGSWRSHPPTAGWGGMTACPISIWLRRCAGRAAWCLRGG